MLCGASDTKNYVPIVRAITNKFNIKLSNYIKGEIIHDNYSNWEENSIANVQKSNILIFIINSHYGKITWETEYKEAISQYKNYLILCNNETFERYRYFSDEYLEFPDELKDKQIFNLLKDLETGNQQNTIIPFTDAISLPIIIEENLLSIFTKGIEEKEKANKKRIFLPILYSSRYNDKFFLESKISTENTIICKEILFDYFQEKQIRKRALEYFTVSKSLSENEIIELCLDSEQGVSRRTIELLSDLVSPNINLSVIFEEIISSISNEEVGLIRRSITSFLNLDIENSLIYFKYFLPANDIGTPKRIILELYEKLDNIKKVTTEKPELMNNLINLINSCIEYNSDKSNWKEIGKSIITTVST